MNTNENKNSRLQKLSGSDYEMVDGQPDIRGWDLQDGAGKDIGTVKELIFDVQSRKVRYMVVDTDKDYTGSRSGKVLIPIGIAKLDKKDDEVRLPGTTADQIASLPEYDDNITPDMENSIRSVFGGLGAAAGTSMINDDFYNHEHFNEDNLLRNRIDTTEDDTTIPVIEEDLNVGKRTVETGGKYIRSRIVEQPVQENINLNEERVYVERNAVDRSATSSDFDTFKEGEIEVKEYAEVPIVAKQARVVEEVKIGKDVEERNETISDTVRKTEVDIENLEGDNKTSFNNSSDL